MREVAAYLMDVNHFCGVPPTLLVHCEHPILNYPARGHGRSGAMFGPSMYPKMGSLQQFVQAGDMFEDLGASVLGDLEVQKIALLDLRLLNCDRNAANILAIRKDPMSLSHSVSGDLDQQDHDICFEENGTPPPSMSGNGEGTSDRYQLVPIDHGYSLPSKLLINEIDWAWFYYPQIDRPVHEEIKKYVQTLDIDAIIATLQQQVTLSEDSLFLIRVAHHLVVDGIAAGLTLFEIASMVARTDEERASSLERAIEEAEENAHRTIEMRVGSVKRSMPHAFTLEDDLVGVNDGLDRCSTSIGKRHRRQNINGRSSNNNDVNYSNSRNSVVDFDTDCSTPSTIAKTSPRARETAANNLAKFLHHSPSSGLKMLRPASSSIDLTNDFTGTRSGHQGDERIIRQHSFDDPAVALRAWTPKQDCDDIIDTSTLETISSPERVDADVDDHGPSDDDDVPERDDYDEVDGEEVDQFDQHLGSLSQFRAFQGLPLQSIKSLDSVQPLIVSVASLSNASNAVLVANKTNKPRPIAPTATVTNGSVVEKVYDSTDSEHSSNGEEAPQTSLRDNETINENSFLIAPSPIRQHHALQSNIAFKRLSVTPIRRPSPLQIGSADPSRYQRSNSRKSLDLLDIDGGYNANDEGDATSPDASDDWFSKSSPLSSSSPLKPPTFLRVTSFSAFSSAPLYDAEGAERRVAKLQKERRRQVAGTEEFNRLRTMFTKNAVTTLISKAVKAKTNQTTLIKAS